MKKVSKKVRRHATKIAQIRFSRRQAERTKRKARLRAAHVETAECFHLVAPPVFSAFNIHQRRCLIRFCAALRRRIVLIRKPVRIDFRKTERMFSCGTALFIAELDRCLRLTGGKISVRYISPRDKIVGQVIQQVGISTLLGRKRKQSDDFDKSVRHWRYATGVHADAKDLDRMLESYEGIVTPALSKSIFRGVTEAMTNCAQHAYLETRRDGLNVRDERRWWMLSQEVDGELSVAFCDLGMGIPRSLPRKHQEQPSWRKALQDLLAGLARHPQESALIKAAIEIGRSRTNADNRGLGLRQIVETAQQLRGSNVLILSNAGGYLLQPDRRTEELLIKYEDSVLGTIIQWNMPIAAGEIHDGKHCEN